MGAARGQLARARGGEPLLYAWARSWAKELRELGWRRDVALAVAVGALQLAGGAAVEWHRHSLGRMGILAWALLVVGPLALLFRRRHPVGTLCVAFGAVLGPAGAGTGYLSLILAFFLAATRAHRRAAWASIVAGYAWSVWLSRLAYGGKPEPASNAIALGAWLVALVVAAEAVRISRERRAEALAARELDERRRASEERLRMARDLHDVIGHNISLINVQAGVGLDLMGPTLSRHERPSRRSKRSRRRRSGNCGPCSTRSASPATTPPVRPSPGSLAWTSS